MSQKHSLGEFVDWWRANITGDEKAEAQIFLDHLMRAFGHAGALEAGIPPDYPDPDELISDGRIRPPELF